MKNQSRILAILERAALTSDHHRKMAAAIVRKGRIVALGVNRAGWMTHPATRHPYHAIHCEFAAIRAALGRKQTIAGSDMVVLRVASYGRAMAKPCCWCAIELADYGIRRIWYTGRDGLLTV